MDRNRILEMLARAEGCVSGEEMSRVLGVTRAAVWKEIEALRQEGFPIRSVPRQGYRLTGPPPGLCAGYISGLLPAGNLFAGKVRVEDKVDSTNTRLKALAAEGAPAGTALLAEEQTGGRGTRGRSFQSPRGDGLYLSVLLRPKASMRELLTLTGWAAVAVREGIERVCGAPCRIKWLNDVYLNGRKLVGILTELSFLGESGEPDYVVIGIGVNVNQTRAAFQAQGLGEIAASLAGEGFPVGRSQLAAALLGELSRMVEAFPQQQAGYLEQYRKYCITPGRAVRFEEDGLTLRGTAREIGDDFALVVDGADGRERRIFSGTVSME